MFSVRVCVCVWNALSASWLYTEIYQTPSGDETTACDRDAKLRWMAERSWPLTLVIRYGCCNWAAVFSINRHYGPLCWPVPLAVLLFLEAPGSSRASALALCIPQVISVSQLSASLHISKESLNSLVEHSVDYEKLDTTEGLTKKFLHDLHGLCKLAQKCMI